MGPTTWWLVNSNNKVVDKMPLASGHVDPLLYSSSVVHYANEGYSLVEFAHKDGRKKTTAPIVEKAVRDGAKAGRYAYMRIVTLGPVHNTHL